MRLIYWKSLSGVSVDKRLFPDAKISLLEPKRFFDEKKCFIANNKINAPVLMTHISIKIVILKF
jgi:hypothetical protein